MDWFPWYPTKFKAETMHLSLAEDGAYRRLIDHYMETRKPLPRDERALARILGVSHDEFLAIAKQVLGYFKAKGKQLHHHRCDIELKIQDERSKKRSESGKLGGEAKAKKKTKTKTSKQVPSKSQASAKQTPSTGQDITGQDKEKKDTDPPLGGGGKNPPKKKTPTRKTTLPEGWEPNETALRMATEEGYDDDERNFIAQQFIDSSIASGRKYADWDRAFYKWIKSGYTASDVEQRRRKRGGNPQGGRGQPASIATAVGRFVAARSDG